VEKDKAQASAAFAGDVTVSWLPDGVKVVSIEPPSVRVSLISGALPKSDKKSNKSE
jgi:hypothetical protein